MKQVIAASQISIYFFVDLTR